MNEIRIQEIIKTEDSIQARIFINENEEIIKTTFNKEIANDTITDRIDAFVWGFLFFALCEGYDIVSDIPITDELYYNLEFHFINALTGCNPSLHRIQIKAPLINGIKGERRIVATGISCGVDSLYTIAQHTSQHTPENNRINTLAFFNAGSSMKAADILRTPLVEGRLQIAKAFPAEYGFDFIFIETNLHLILNKYLTYSHTENHTYMALFCIYHIQNKIKTYYYSSGYSYAEFTLKRENHNAELGSAHYDLLTLSMASINNIRFYSAGSEANRLEKTKYIISYKPAQKYLNVCVNESQNDSKCFKCIRTLLTLDALNVIDDYRAVFDVDYYKTHRQTYIRRMYLEATFRSNSFYKEIIPYYKDQLTLLFKLRVFTSVIKNKIFDLFK